MVDGCRQEKRVPHVRAHNDRHTGLSRPLPQLRRPPGLLRRPVEDPAACRGNAIHGGVSAVFRGGARHAKVAQAAYFGLHHTCPHGPAACTTYILQKSRGERANFFFWTGPPIGSVLHNSPCSLRTCTGLAYFGLHHTCPHVYQPVVRGHLDPDFLHHVLPL